MQAGAAKAELVEGGTRIFLGKVLNKAGVTSQLMTEVRTLLRFLCSPMGAQSPPSPSYRRIRKTDGCSRNSLTRIRSHLSWPGNRT
jgi:hypothetical protein